MMLAAITPAVLAVFQVASSSPGTMRQADPSAPVAVLAVRAPVIDGKPDDGVWRDAELITEFREFQPREDGDPRFATEARVAYDAHNFYVFVRMFDPHPDSILHLMARRDVRTASDQIKIIIDSYRDRRTGYEFAVNPAGVKRDYAIYNDAQPGMRCGTWPPRSTPWVGPQSSAFPCPSCGTLPAPATRSGSGCGGTYSVTPSG